MTCLYSGVMVPTMRLFGLFPLLGVFGLLLGSPAHGHAQDSNEIKAIRQQILFADYDKATAEATKYLRRSDLTAKERNAGLEVLAISFLANRDERKATPVLAALFSRDPEHRLGDPDASPVVQAGFARARERNKKLVKVTVQNLTPESHTASGPPLIKVRVREDLSAVHEVRLGYRDGPQGDYQQIVMPLKAGVGTAKLPVERLPRMQTVSYYVQVLAPSGAKLAEMGHSTAPILLQVPSSQGLSATGQLDTETPWQTGTQEDAPKAKKSKWWIALVVVGVAALAVGAYFLFAKPGASPQGTLGAVELQ